MYMLFAGDDYYPAAGLGDLRGIFTTLGEAKGIAINDYREKDWIKIYEINIAEDYRKWSLVYSL